MSRKTKTTASVNTEKKSPKFTHGALLGDALTWVVNDRMLADISLHGNIKWKHKKKRSKKLSAPVKPQMWITLICHMGLKMPWARKTGALTSSERHHFLVRVGANVRLLKNLGHARERDGIVYVWPDAAARRKQPPLVLRLIQIKNERGTMSLVTSVLNERKLSNAKVAKLYSMRRGIELQLRSFKQTFGRRQLRSRTSECSYVETGSGYFATRCVVSGSTTRTLG